MAEKIIKAWKSNGMAETVRAAEKRALIPYALSEAVCLATEKELYIKEAGRPAPAAL
jgi:hypothetical protein